jgi:hypothetical protein
MASLRAIYSYFMDIPLEDVPYLSFPLHTAVCLTEMPYGMEEKVCCLAQIKVFLTPKYRSAGSKS